MTAPAPNVSPYVWVEVAAVTKERSPDTLFGHGTTFGTNPAPVEGEGQFDLATGSAQRYVSGAWEPHTAVEGDEYMDMDSGITHSLTVQP